MIREKRLWGGGIKVRMHCRRGEEGRVGRVAWVCMGGWSEKRSDG